MNRNTLVRTSTRPPTASRAPARTGPRTKETASIIWVIPPARPEPIGHQPGGPTVYIVKPGEGSTEDQRKAAIEKFDQAKARVLEKKEDFGKVAGELATLARNSAAQLGGDTVVATSEITDGSQTFAVYRCGRD